MMKWAHWRPRPAETALPAPALHDQGPAPEVVPGVEILGRVDGQPSAATMPKMSRKEMGALAASTGRDCHARAATSSTRAQPLKPNSESEITKAFHFHFVTLPRTSTPKRAHRRPRTAVGADCGRALLHERPAKGDVHGVHDLQYRGEAPDEVLLP